MEELKLLIETVAHLPTMTLWVLLGYLVYKLAIVGSTFGLIRFAIDKLHNWLTNRHKTIELDGTIGGMCITADSSDKVLIAQLHRLRGKGTKIGSQYIHRESVDWLRQAIDAKEAEDAKR